MSWLDFLKPNKNNSANGPNAIQRNPSVSNSALTPTKPTNNVISNSNSNYKPNYNVPVSVSSSSNYQNPTQPVAVKPNPVATTPQELSPIDKYKQFIDSQILDNKNQTNPYSDQALSYVNKVMSPGYSSLTPEQQNQEYQSRATDLVNNVFTPNENRWLTRMGSNAYSGSGKRYWENQIANPENQTLANLKNEITNRNITQTREDQSNALGLIPSMSAQTTENKRYPLTAAMQWAAALMGDKNAQAQIAAQKAQADASKQSNEQQGLGGLLGGLLNFFV